MAVGLGPFAGVLALWVHTTGVLAKLFSEAVEAIDPRPWRACDRRERAGEIVYGVIPQVLPLWISYSLYRFESNVRSASVVGHRGAGGIGTVLWDIIRSFRYAETCAVMIIIVAFVVVIDMTSARIRKALWRRACRGPFMPSAERLQRGQGPGPAVGPCAGLMPTPPGAASGSSACPGRRRPAPPAR